MFKILEDIKKSISNYDEISDKDKYMSNPFKKAKNQTYVWTEKSFFLNRKVK